MFEMTEKLRERFCKDMNLPIKIFVEPYFTERLVLIDFMYKSVEKFELFKKELEKYSCAEDYFAAYNKLKDDAIMYLRENEAMKEFCECDISSLTVKYEDSGLPSKDIYKVTNDGRYFLSIDMKKANFTSLKHYNKDIVGGKETYEDFLGMFTDSEYFKKSKYIRQVIFGNLNPKRQVRYEKHLMGELMEKLLEFTPIEDIKFYSNDEIVIDMTRFDISDLDLLSVECFTYIDNVQSILLKFSEEGIDLRQELFKLCKFENVQGFFRYILAGTGQEVGTKDLKCVSSVQVPFVMRAFRGEEPVENDGIFVSENGLAKLVSLPKVNYKLRKAEL